jgi:hypothetical protein
MGANEGERLCGEIVTRRPSERLRQFKQRPQSITLLEPRNNLRFARKHP